jgi:hypothetical protein
MNCLWVDLINKGIGHNFLQSKLQKVKKYTHVSTHADWIKNYNFQEQFTSGYNTLPRYLNTYAGKSKYQAKRSSEI